MTLLTIILHFVSLVAMVFLAAGLGNPSLDLTALSLD